MPLSAMESAGGDDGEMGGPPACEALMPNLLQYDPIRILGFLLIFARLAGLMLTAPVFGDNNIPVQVKTFFVLILSLLFYPVVTEPHLGGNPDPLQMLVLTLGELGVGLLLGFSARLLFVGIGLGGEIAGFQMGLGIANVVDPATGQQTPVLSQLQVTLAMLLFVVLDGHLLLIRAVAESYELVGPGAISLSQQAYEYYVNLTGNLFLIGLQIGAPLIVALLAANFAIGLIARSVPQVNIFVVGFPFTIALGLLFLVLGFPFFIKAVLMLHDRLEGLMVQAMRVLGAG